MRTNVPTGTAPTFFAHQQEFFEATKNMPAWAVLFEQGCGKTAPTIRTAEHLYCEHKIDGVVVVAPNSVHRNWITDELPKHATVAWLGLDWHSDRGAPQDRELAAMLEVKPSNAAFGSTKNQRLQCLAWLAITYEGMITVRGRNAILNFAKRYSRFMLVMDEASRVKNPEALRTKKTAALRRMASHARLLNGSPVGNSALDVYAQMKLLDENFWIRHGIGSWTSFRSRFAVTKRIPIGGDDDREDRGGSWRDPIVPHGATAEGVAAFEQLDLTGIIAEDEVAVVAASVPEKKTTGRTIEVVVGFRELDKLREMIAPMSTRVTKAECLDLPPKLYSRLTFDMTVEQRRVYDQLRRDYMVELDNGVLITAAIALVRLMRLQQVACGYLPNPDDPENPKLFFDDAGKNPRISLLMDRLEDTPHQAIIWARFTRDVDAITQLLGPPKCSRYDGEVTGKNRIRELERFREGKAKFIVAKTASMGTGLTLIEAKSAFYYSNTFEYIARIQSEDRCHRIGVVNPVNYYDLVASRSIDGKILKSLQSNEDVANKVTGDSYRGWLEES